MKLTTIDDLERLSKEETSQALSMTALIPRIESYLEDMNLEDNYSSDKNTKLRRLGVFSASDIGNRSGKSLCGTYPMGCARMLYYRYTCEKPEEQIIPRIRRLFDTGTKIHEQLQEYLHKVADQSDGKEIFVSEYYFNEDSEGRDIDAASTTDGIWEMRVTGKAELRYGLEIKSINDAGFQKLNGPHAEHIVQSHVYMGCLNLPLMVIMYYNKNDSSMAEFAAVFDPAVWAAIKAKVASVIDAAVFENPPEREAGYHCKMCRYAHVCEPPRRNDKLQTKLGKRRLTSRS